MAVINCNGKILDLSTPKAMGILNLTPDSFYSNSRKQTEKEILERAFQIVEEGAAIIDIGAYSSRLGADDITPEEEMSRLRFGLSLIRAEMPDAIISIDTFRADVARMCVEEYGVDMINDISAGEQDSQMYRTIADLDVPYIIMHMRGNPRTMQQAVHYNDIASDIISYFNQKIATLRQLGVKDIIIDPGFGFSKTCAQNFQLLERLECLNEIGLPLLVGLSRKSMIYKTLQIQPADGLNGTTVLNTIAIGKGAKILRVHDVRECVEAIRLIEEFNAYRTGIHGATNPL